VIATVLSTQVIDGSFFTWQLRRRGIDLGHGRRGRQLRRIQAREIMDRVYATIGPEASLADIRRLFQTAPHGELFVVGDGGGLIGTITFHELRDVEFEDGDEPSHTAGDICRRAPPVLLASDSLNRALDIFERSEDPHIAVVEDRELCRLIGLVHERDVMLALNRALARVEAEGGPGV